MTFQDAIALACFCFVAGVLIGFYVGLRVR
jgi:hypothetical protein